MTCKRILSGICPNRTILALSWALGAALVTSAPARAAANPLFGYSHMQSTPFTLPAGVLQYGTVFAYGITDFLQVSTDVLRDIYKIWNIEGKVSIFDQPEFALALTMGWESFNYRDISPLNPDLRVTAWKPGGVFTHALLEDVAMFYGANLYLTDHTKPAGSLNSGYTVGARLGSDIAWAYGSGGDQGIGNVLAAGVTWDVTFQTLGFGFSHHWPGFKIGIHYYPTADEYKVQPILVGGGSVAF